MGAVELRSLDLDTEGCLDARAERLRVAEGEHTTVVDLRLDERGGVEVGLRADLEHDLAVGRLVRRLRARLDVARHTVVVRRGVILELVRGEERDGVLGRAEPETGGVLVDLARGDVVAGLTAEEEAVVSNDRVCGYGRALIRG